MPRFDGTGPRGQGPFTGHGEGYCAMHMPDPATDAPMSGYAGIQGTPVQVARWPAPGMGQHLFMATPFVARWPGYYPGYGCVRGRRRGRRFGR